MGALLGLTVIEVVFEEAADAVKVLLPPPVIEAVKTLSAVPQVTEYVGLDGDTENVSAIAA